jgi:hypothetical protein
MRGSEAAFYAKYVWRWIAPRRLRVLTSALRLLLDCMPRA